ncbi:hypothetical protein N7U66_01995 [Lacinutrix neustonica]|uniref:Uncharacterized protein n=1 Tax=Lacinutrix neustonica TaxID=2980107 RepID=A0A9E8SDJ5_9FLAO|nr:hypothetical protein [Lacinutrix neustonica]WAC02508.1 hypothetical protein N7U66_01995 [Lacinutrix neustonica]
MLNKQLVTDSYPSGGVVYTAPIMGSLPPKTGGYKLPIPKPTFINPLLIKVAPTQPVLSTAPFVKNEISTATSTPVSSPKVLPSDETLVKKITETPEKTSSFLNGTLKKVKFGKILKFAIPIGFALLVIVGIYKQIKVNNKSKYA